VGPAQAKILFWDVHSDADNIFSYLNTLS
jgi:hypothetical protein